MNIVIGILCVFGSTEQNEPRLLSVGAKRIFVQLDCRKNLYRRYLLLLLYEYYIKLY